MRKTTDISSDVNSSYERVIILVFKIQNGWNDVIFQLIHLTGQWYHSLMNWLSSFAITVLGIDAPTLAKKSAQLAGNLPQLRQDRSFSSSLPKTKKIEQSCVLKQWKWPLNYSNSCFALLLLLLCFYIFAPGPSHGVWDPRSWGMQDLQLQHVRSSSLNRERTWAPCIASTESWPLDHPGSPCSLCLMFFDQGNVPMQFSFLFSSNSWLSLHVFRQLAWRDYFDTDILSFIRRLWTRQIPGSVGSEL